MTTLANYERHARRFGAECVFESAAEDLGRSELRQLAETLTRLDPTFAVAGDVQREAAYRRVVPLIDR